MIFTFLITGFFTIINNILNLLPTLPAYVNFEGSAIVDFTDLIFSNAGLLDIIAPISLIKLYTGGMILLLTTKLIFDIVMFVLKKIPIANIK